MEAEYNYQEINWYGKEEGLDVEKDVKHGTGG